MAMETFIPFADKKRCSCRRSRQQVLDAAGDAREEGMTRLLLTQHNINPNLGCSRWDNTALRCASSHCKANLVRLLLAHPKTQIDCSTLDSSALAESLSSSGDFRGLSCPSRAPEVVVLLVAHGAATDTPAVQEAASNGTSQRAYLGRGIAFRSQVLAWVAARRVQLDKGLQEAAPGLPSGVRDLVSGFDTPTTTEAVAAVQAADPVGWTALITALRITSRAQICLH
jgi:hypothetical protein